MLQAFQPLLSIDVGCFLSEKLVLHSRLFLFPKKRHFGHLGNVFSQQISVTEFGRTTFAEEGCSRLPDASRIKAVVVDFGFGAQLDGQMVQCLNKRGVKGG